MRRAVAMIGGRWRRVAPVVGLLWGLSGAAGAVDTPPSSDLPDLSEIRAAIYSGDFDSAVRRLTGLTATVKHADLYNLLGYYYDPTHRPALEYQGELFIAVGDLPAARGNVGLLRLLCPKGCAELDTLETVVVAAENRVKSGS